MNARRQYIINNNTSQSLTIAHMECAVGVLCRRTSLAALAYGQHKKKKKKETPTANGEGRRNAGRMNGICETQKKRRDSYENALHCGIYVSFALVPTAAVVDAIRPKTISIQTDDNCRTAIDNIYIYTKTHNRIGSAPALLIIM